jgi:hypothetical protein
MCVHANHETIFFLHKPRHLMQLCSSMNFINVLAFPRNNDDIADERSLEK